MVEVQFPLKVMEPIRVDNLPMGDYLYQVKWDGMRWITYKSTLQAVCLGMMLDASLVYVGTVSNGATSILRSEVALSIRESETSPFVGRGPTPGRGETIRWLEPTMLLKTKFLEWTDEGKLRHAQLI